MGVVFKTALVAVWKVLDDIVLAVWFGTKLRPKSGMGRAERVVRTVIACFLMFFFFWFLTNYRKNVILSFAARVAGAVIYYSLCKEESQQKTWYAAGIYSLAFYGHTVVFVTPVLAMIRKQEILLLPAYPVLNWALVQTVMFLVASLMTAVVRNGIDYTKIQDHWEFRGMLVSVLAVLEIYLKYIMNAFSKREEQIVEMTVLACIIMALILVVLVFTELYLVHEDEEREHQKMELLQVYQYENMKEQIAGAEDVRILYHDMKNHLISMGNLTGDDGKIAEYLSDMKEKLSRYESGVETGNSMLNGLLRVKLRQVREKGIPVEVFVDLKGAAFLRDMDICTIFGNAIDNALEASERVEPVRRSIRIRSGIFANNLVIRFENACQAVDQALLFAGQDGMPQTTKRDREHHGLGLTSVKRVVSRYQGTVSVEQKDGKFILKIMIPLP